MMKILIAGDFGCGDRIVKLSQSGKGKDILEPISEIVKNCDYSIVNLEAPLKGDGKPIDKRGPHIYSNNQSIEMLKECGFDCCTLANNHFRDWGEEGVNQTLTALDGIGFDHVGGGKNIEEARETLYVKRGLCTIAIVNVCESEFNIASKDQGGSAPLDVMDVFYRIKEAKSKADTILVIVHGGHERFSLPSPRMKRTYRFFVDIGADAVINHHQHCYSGYEVYKDKPIFYGLGNFCFDKPNRRNEAWNEGYMVELNIENNNVAFEIHPFTQCNEEPTVKPMSPEENKKFQENISKLNTVIANEDLLETSYSNYIDKKFKTSIIDFSPFNSKLFRGLSKKGIIPNCISFNKALLLFDRISCESHRDITLGILSRKINK